MSAFVFICKGSVVLSFLKNNPQVMYIFFILVFEGAHFSKRNYFTACCQRKLIYCIKNISALFVIWRNYAYINVGKVGGICKDIKLFVCFFPFFVSSMLEPVGNAVGMNISCSSFGKLNGNVTVHVFKFLLEFSVTGKTVYQAHETTK